MNSYRLTVCDYYMSSPIRGLDVTHSEFHGTGVKQVPVIRIFGSTIDGKKACVHIHGVFPYIYIPYEGSELPDRLKYQLATSLDKSINVSLGQANASTQHVFKIILVSGIPYYGYHEKEHQFFKIYFFNPNIVKKATELLQNGVILGKVHQPHEAHVPFILQFMIDYNLQGMNLVNCSHVQHRVHLNQHDEDEENSSSTPTSIDAPLRVSCCEIEVDVAASDILNRTSDVSSQSVVNPGLAALWEDEHQRRREQGRETQLTPQSSQVREEKPSASEDFYRQRLLIKLEELTQSSDDSFSTQQTDGSSIMYPAEVPEGKHLLDASFVDFHTPRTLSNILDQCRDKDEAGPSNSANYSQLMDSQDAELLGALEELAVSQEVEEQQPVEHLDDDSILSSTSQKPLHLQNQIQAVKEDEDDDYFEMTQPISLLLSPNIPQNLNESNCDTIIAESDDDQLIHSPRKVQVLTLSQSSDENSYKKSNSQSDVQIYDDSSHQDSDNPEDNIEDNEESVQNNVNMYSMSQTSLNASLLGDLLDEELWTDVENIPNIPQYDGADDPEPSTSKGRGRRLGARGPLKPNKNSKTPPFISPLLNKDLSQNSTSSSGDSVIVVSCIQQNSSQDSENFGKDVVSNPSDIILSQSSCNSDSFNDNLSQNIIENININEKLDDLIQGDSQNFNKNIPDTQPLSPETSESCHTSVYSKNSELNMVIDVIKSQEEEKTNEQNLQFNNETSTRSKNKIIEFLQSKSNLSSNIPPLPNTSRGVETIDLVNTNKTQQSYASEELVTGLCNELQWPTTSGGGENELRENLENINDCELDLPEGATAMELLEEELAQNNSNSKKVQETEKNTETGSKKAVPKIQIRKSTRLSLRPKVRYRNLSKYVKKNVNNKINNSFRKSSKEGVSETVNIPRNTPTIPLSKSSTQVKKSKSQPSTSQCKASTSQYDSSTSRHNPSASHCNPSTSHCNPSTSGKPQITISIEDKNKDKIINFIPENKVPGVKNCEVTYESSGQVRSRGRPVTKKHTFNIELDLPKKKISIDLQIAPNSIGSKKMKLSYQIENTPNKKKKRQPNKTNMPKKKSLPKEKSTPKENVVVKACYVRLEKLSDEFVKNASKQRNTEETNLAPEDSTDERDSDNEDDCNTSMIGSPSENLSDNMIDNEVKIPSSQEKSESMYSRTHSEVPNSQEGSESMSPKTHSEVPDSQEGSESMSPRTVNPVILSSEESENMSYKTCPEIQDLQEESESMSPKTYSEIQNLKERSESMSPKTVNPVILSSEKSENMSFKTCSEIPNLQEESESMSPKTYSEEQNLQEGSESMSPRTVNPVRSSSEESENISYKTCSEIPNLQEECESMSPKEYSSHLINKDSKRKHLDIVQQTSKSKSDSKTNLQVISIPSTSQSSINPSSNDANNSKKSTSSPRKKSLVSKLKSANSKKAKRNVSFSPLHIVIEKSPLKAVVIEVEKSPVMAMVTEDTLSIEHSDITGFSEESMIEENIDEEDVVEKNIPRRKLDYNSSYQDTGNNTIDECIPIAIDSDSDIIENSDDDISVLKITSPFSDTSSKGISVVKTTENNDIKLISKVLPEPNSSGTVKKRGRKRKIVKSSDIEVQMITFPERDSTDVTKEKDSISSGNAAPLEILASPHESHIKTRASCAQSTATKSQRNISKSSNEFLETPPKKSQATSNESKNVKHSKNGVGPSKKEPDKRRRSDLSFIIEESEEEEEANHFGIMSFYDISQSELSPNKDKDITSSPELNLKLEGSDSDNETKIEIQNCILEPIYNPPNYKEVIETLKENNLQEIKFQEPYYSFSSDVRNKNKEIGGKTMRLISHAACDLQEYQSSVVDTCIKTKSIIPLKNTIYIEPLFNAPTFEEVATCKTEKLVDKTPNKNISTIRIQVPSSPGGDNSDNESLSLSPCSDVNSQSWAPISPASNSQGRSKSPLIHSTPMPKALARCMTPRRLSTQSDSCCRIDGPSPLNNTFGFRVALENLQDARAVIQPQQLTVLALELHVSTRGELRPDPDTDPIKAAFFLVSRDDGLGSQEMGVIAVQTDIKTQLLSHTRSKCKLNRVNDEKSLVLTILEVVKLWDPDILLGYEIEMASWGYLIQRAAYLEMNLANLLSRVQKRERGPARTIIQQEENNKSSHHQHPASQGVTYEATELKVTGRIILNLWRLMKHELALQSYVFENVAYHILHERVPQHSFHTLTYWWEHPSKRYHWIVTDYWLYRVEGASRLLDQLDLLGRTSELAKLFGIQFYEVLSRGSQFRVESMMLRLAKPRNFVPVSPSIMQRAHMKAPEYIPLILEPESKYYEDPVIVLDFQSLYPSIIIAYNYCFSTCLGRVEHLGQEGPFPFGCTQLKVPIKLVRKISKTATISPCGVAFVKAKMREGVLPRMLREILDTRLMVKKSMKENKNDATLQRVLHARQLGLKLIANVTYGYTSANFSGRMPCIEVGDSVVSKGKETLDRAIQMVTQNEAKWGARVVYGDTDSMFVLVPGRTRQQAFEIGAQIAAAVTADNPTPVKLKLEKVYHPCILQTKKRYVGYMYESTDQKDPVYEAKGIETVRRDGCPAVAKILEKSLRFLFETQDVSYVKQYVVRQYQKLLLGRSNMQDLVFAREFRGFAGYKPGACVPALELTRQWIRVDRRAEPRSGERVPYVVVNGAPGLPLIRLIRSPHDLLKDQSLRINAEYYITRAIAPALDRCFSLLGADVHQWYAEMPRRTIAALPTSTNTAGSSRPRGTISQYFATIECAACREQTREGLCVECQTQPQKAALVLSNKLRRWERTASNIAKVCSSCCERNYDTTCCSLVCPILFRRNQAERELEQAPFVRQLIIKFLDF